MALNSISMETLSRIEGVIDALEARGMNSSSFFALCEDLQKQLDTVTEEQSSGIALDKEVAKRVKLIVDRLRKLEAFASAQAEITSGLQKHIANPDK